MNVTGRLEASGADARSEFRRARTFAVYYGRDRLREIALFDVCILEPAARARAEVKALLRGGTLPVAYLSCMEWGEHLAYYGAPGIRDYLLVRGGRVFRPEFDTWVMDPRSAGWRETVGRAAAWAIRGLGFRGLFLDTLDDAEGPYLPVGIRGEVVSAAARLVGEIRSAFGAAVIIQNRGLNWVFRRTAPLIDGICWEGFRRGEGDTHEAAWVAARLREIKNACGRHGLRLLLLDRDAGEAPCLPAEVLASEFRLMRYAAPGSYERGINLEAAPAKRVSQRYD